MAYFPTTEKALKRCMFDHEMHLERVSRGEIISFTHFRRYGKRHYAYLAEDWQRTKEKFPEFYKEVIEG